MSTMHFIEQNENTVLITMDKSKAPKEGYLPYPLRYRSFISDVFQWSMIEAYTNDGWTIIMDEGIQDFWNSRPSHFRRSIT